MIVATKKDDLMDLAFSAHRKGLKKAGLSFDEEACDRAAEEHLANRLDTIRHELESIPGGRLDALVAVSQGKRFPKTDLQSVSANTLHRR